MEEFRGEFVPDGKMLPIKNEEQKELFNPDFTIEANLVKYSAVFPAHSPDTPLYTTKHFDKVPGGLAITALTTSTSPFEVRGKTVADRVPGDFEKKVFYAIVSIWVTNGKPADGIVQFSIAKLIEQLGMSRGGKSYKMVKEAISRINRSTIKIQGSYVSAPDFRKDTREFSLFSHCRESESRRGRKSASGSVESDFYKITLNTAIVSNMIHDYSIVIQVKDYTSASSKYYRRLVDIIEFEFQKGSCVGKDRIEFLLTQLAKNLPLEGEASNVSTILKRLGTSFRELEELGGYKCSVRKIDNNAIFTVFSKSFSKALDYKKTFEELISEYFEIHQKIYQASLESTLAESKKSIMDFLTADDSETAFNSETFPKTILILDTLVFQYYVRNTKKKLKNWAANNEEKSSIIRIARSILNGSNPLKHPDGFKPYTERFKDFEALLTKNSIETAETARSQNANDEAHKQASALFAELSIYGRNFYVKRIREEIGLKDESVIVADRLIVDEILNDILNGELNKSFFANLQPNRQAQLLAQA